MTATAPPRPLPRHPTPPAGLVVATLVADGVAPFEFGVLCEVFGLDRSADGGPTFDHRVVTEHPGVIRTNQGFGITVDLDLSAAADADVICVPALADHGDNGSLSPAVRDLLVAAEARGAWLISVCSGAFVLAEAGLLDGRRSTTHWLHSDRLQADHPGTTVDADVLFVEDRRVITSAGTAAGIDACLHFVRRVHGAAAANVIARRMVVPAHRDGGQSQFIERPMPVEADSSLAPLTDWMLAHLDRDLPVEVLAARAHMSPRTFARRFKAELGTTPAAWLTSQRLLRSQRLLESTGLGLDAIAGEVGFGSAAVLRHHFGRVLGTTPRSYRAMFAGPDELAELARA